MMQMFRPPLQFTYLTHLTGQTVDSITPMMRVAAQTDGIATHIYTGFKDNNHPDFLFSTSTFAIS